jgi:hypothetical protein
MLWARRRSTPPPEPKASTGSRESSAQSSLYAGDSGCNEDIKRLTPTRTFSTTYMSATLAARAGRVQRSCASRRKKVKDALAAKASLAGKAACVTASRKQTNVPQTKLRTFAFWLKQDARCGAAAGDAATPVATCVRLPARLCRDIRAWSAES